MKKYCVLQIHNFYQIPGGEDVVVRNEKKLLEDHGHQVFTYYRSNGELKDGGKLKKLLLPFTAVYSFRTYREVKKIIRENQIDLVHVHNTLTMVSPSVFYAAFHCKVPVVQTLHNFRMLCPAGSFFRDNAICEECTKGGFSCAVRHKCYRGSAAQTIVSAVILKIHRMLGTYYRVNFICLTEFNRNKLLHSLEPKKRIVNPKRVFIKPNFTFADHVPSGAEEKKSNRTDVQPDEEYFLFAGRLEALKGIDVAVRAFEKLPDKQLYVAGTGPMAEEMQQYVASHHLKNIRFLGYLQKEEMAEKFRHAKAVVMTSQCYEAFAMTIAEAYSYGVPVIAGRVGNMEGMVQEGVTGVKFTYNSPEDLAEKIRVFEQMDLSMLKKNAGQFYLERLLPEDNYKQLMRIYRSISKEQERR